MKHNYVFECLRVILKPLEKSDIEDLRILRNQEAQFFLNQNEISKEAQKKWYQNYLNKKDDIMFMVAKKEAPNDFIGAIAAYDIDWEKKECEVGRTVIDKVKAPEKGIGTDATKAVCAFCFEILKMKKIKGVVLKDNARILKVDERVGFKIIGDYDEKSFLLELTPDTLIKE